MRTHHRFSHISYIVLALSTALAPAAAAQVTGSIAGTIRDASGAVVPGATVSVRGAALQRESASTTTGDDGTYRLPLLPPGTYRVTADLSGFSPKTVGGIEVALNQQTTLDITLGVG